jgi:hypothetical protein
MADKVDLKKSLDSYQARRGQFRIVEVPERQYLMVDGHGDPNSSPAFTEAVEALYPVAYTLKFTSKRDLGRDYVVPPLEGLWWAQDMEAFTVARDKSQWDWTLLLLVPDWIGGDLVDGAIAKFGTKVRLEALSEGRCVQTVHVGTFDAEAPVLAQMHDEFIPDNGLRRVGTHHEIYLSDFRRTAPEKQRTILRQPVAPVP